MLNVWCMTCGVVTGWLGDEENALKTVTDDSAGRGAGFSEKTVSEDKEGVQGSDPTKIDRSVLASHIKGTLTLTIHKAKDLYKSQLIGKMDPYMQLWTTGERFKTKPAKGGTRLVPRPSPLFFV